MTLADVADLLAVPPPVRLPRGHAYWRRWYAAHRLERKLYLRAWRAKNRARANAYAREYRARRRVREVSA